LFADYSAIEYRVLAFYLDAIGYPLMAEEFRAGLDPHRQTALRLLGKDDLADEERQFGKTFNFASIYGAGPMKIGTMLKKEGVILPEGQTPKSLFERFHEVNPGVRKLSNPEPRWNDPYWVPGALEMRMMERGHVRTLWGRELHPILKYKVLNYLCQGCAADLMRSAMVRVHDYLKDFRSHLVLSIHDELQLDCVDEEVPVIAKALPVLMSDDRIASVVPVEVDIEISYDTWATKEGYVG